MDIKSLIKKKLPAFAAWYRSLRDRREAGGEAKITPFGFKFVGRSDMQDGTFEAKEVEIFRKLVQGVDVMVNAGAHDGYYCAHALSFGKPVIAFEPMPINCKVLLKNIAINNWESRAEVFQMALADKVGVSKMYGSGTGSSLVEGWNDSSSAHYELVPVSSLDVVLRDRLNGKKTLVLIDVEGFEYKLLAAAKNLLHADPKPIWMIEITLRENQPGGRENPHFLETFELFWNEGYDAYCIAKKGITLVTKEILKLNPKDRHELLASPNFIFVHPSSGLKF